MKRYLAVFTSSSDATAQWELLSDQERQKRQAEGMSAWKKWVDDNAQSIVDLGGPLSHAKLVSRDGVSDINNSLAAYTVVEADSQESAAALFENHPHFTIFPGEGVEIMEILPIPGP